MKGGDIPASSLLNEEANSYTESNDLIEDEQQLQQDDAETVQENVRDLDSFKMPFIIFKTIDNNQQIEVMYNDLQEKLKLFIGTQ